MLKQKRIITTKSVLWWNIIESWTNKSFIMAESACFRQVTLGGHSLCLASSQQRIFASSWHWACRYFVGCRSIASLHLRIFGCQDFLKPSPHLRIFASSHLRLSRCSQTLSASSHLCIFASSALSRNVKIRYFLSQKVKIRAMSRKNARNCVPSRLRILISPALTNYLTNWITFTFDITEWP